VIILANLILSGYASALKEILLPYIRDNFPKKTILLDQMKRNAGVNVINDEFIAPIYTNRHGGVANLADDNNNIISIGKLKIDTKRRPAIEEMSQRNAKASIPKRGLADTRFLKTMGIIDKERAAKVSGARFTYLKGAGAKLQFALTQYALDNTDIADPNYATVLGDRDNAYDAYRAFFQDDTGEPNDFFSVHAQVPFDFGDADTAKTTTEENLGELAVQISVLMTQVEDAQYEYERAYNDLLMLQEQKILKQ